MGNFMRAKKYELFSGTVEISKENQDNFNQLIESDFNEKQWSQITIGYKRNLDFIRYADTKYSHSQMFELRVALQYSDYIKNEDLNFLFDDKWNNEQMRELRLGMLAGIDYSIYADVSFTATQMRNIRIDLEESES